MQQELLKRGVLWSGFHNVCYALENKDVDAVISAYRETLPLLGSAGRYQSIIELPGFTRGLDFAGHLAFVGLSQVRESALSSGMQITERLKPEARMCGVWVIDIRSGQIVAFLKFEGHIREVFAVSVLPGSHYPKLANHDAALIGDSFVLPDEALQQVPEGLRNSSNSRPQSAGFEQ